MQPSLPSQTGSEGFTLLEVLVALAILGVSLATLLGVFGQSLDRDHQIAQRMAVRNLAQSLLAQAEADPVFGSGGRSGVEHGLAWRLSERPVSADGDALMLTEIDVAVAPENQSPLRLTSLRLSAKEPSP